MELDDFQYQDIRVNGKTISKGVRECESRYEALLPFLDRYKKRKTFTVLDFGANYGYFSWRIKEDFPNAEITMVDPRPLLKLLYDINNVKGIKLISQYLHDFQIQTLGEFDLILLMSVLHHFDNPNSILDIFLEIGETLIIETDYSDIPNFTNRQKEIQDYLKTKNPIQINKWIAHDRPIYYLNKNERGIIGKVTSGQKIAQANIPHFNWIFDWFGIELFPGTLNIVLNKPINFESIFKINNYSFIQMYLNGFFVLAIKDTLLTPNYYYLEVVSPINLREKFNLEDEDEVLISFNTKQVKVIK
jgi:SAM-dependent methyltransferase